MAAPNSWVNLKGVYKLVPEAFTNEILRHPDTLRLSTVFSKNEGPNSKSLDFLYIHGCYWYCMRDGYDDTLEYTYADLLKFLDNVMLYSQLLPPIMKKKTLQQAYDIANTEELRNKKATQLPSMNAFKPISFFLVMGYEPLKSSILKTYSNNFFERVPALTIKKKNGGLWLTLRNIYELGKDLNFTRSKKTRWTGQVFQLQDQFTFTDIELKFLTEDKKGTSIFKRISVIDPDINIESVYKIMSERPRLTEFDFEPTVQELTVVFKVGLRSSKDLLVINIFRSTSDPLHETREFFARNPQEAPENFTAEKPTNQNSKRKASESTYTPGKVVCPEEADYRSKCESLITNFKEDSKSTDPKVKKELKFRVHPDRIREGHPLYDYRECPEFSRSCFQFV